MTLTGGPIVVQSVTFFQNCPLAPDGLFESIDSCNNKELCTTAIALKQCQARQTWIVNASRTENEAKVTCTALRLISRSSGLKSVLPKPTWTLPALSARYSTLPPLKSLTAYTAALNVELTFWLTSGLTRVQTAGPI